MMRLMTMLLVLGGAILLASAPAPAVTPAEALDDPALEGRARALSAGIRCLVCQNQSIDDSDADLAKDLRVLIRKRLKAGDDETKIRAYLVDRYGEFILLKPPVRRGTWLLWFGPLIIFLMGAAGLVFYLRARAPQAPSAAGDLSAAERGRLEEILDEDGDRK
jgi:cytochrome c-type biogenesis protein CcmH